MGSQGPELLGSQGGWWHPGPLCCPSVPRQQQLKLRSPRQVLQSYPFGLLLKKLVVLPPGRCCVWSASFPQQNFLKSGCEGIGWEPERPHTDKKRQPLPRRVCSANRQVMDSVNIVVPLLQLGELRRGTGLFCHKVKVVEQANSRALDSTLISQLSALGKILMVIEIHTCYATAAGKRKTLFEMI